MMDLKQHPLSAAFPQMGTSDWEEHKASVLELGVLNPVTIYQGMVIDGWHRYRAAKEVGVNCPSQLLQQGVDPQKFVIAQNKARRNLTAAQLAAATVMVYEWHGVGANQHSREGTECPPSKSTSDLAEIAGVSERTIKQAKVVQSKGAQAVQEAVKSGKLGLPKAAAIARLPEAEQAAAIDKPSPRKPKPEPAAEEHYDPEKDGQAEAMQGLLEEVDALKLRLAVVATGASEEEQGQYAELLKEKDRRIKNLESELSAVKSSRDGLMQTNNVLKNEVLSLQRRLKRHEGK